MSNGIVNQYNPDFVLPPGEILQEVLETRGMTQADLSERTGCSLQTINDIINGKAAITPHIALQFERALDISDSFWNNLEHYYSQYLWNKSLPDKWVKYLLTERIVSLISGGLPGVANLNGFTQPLLTAIRNIQLYQLFVAIHRVLRHPKPIFEMFRAR